MVFGSEISRFVLIFWFCDFWKHNACFEEKHYNLSFVAITTHQVIF